MVVGGVGVEGCSDCSIVRIVRLFEVWELRREGIIGHEIAPIRLTDWH